MSRTLHHLKHAVFKINQARIRRIWSKRSTEEFFFIQIGAADGKSGDPIHEFIKKYKWHGILVEPLKDIFDILVKNYEGCEGLNFENVAIDNESGLRDFYRIKRKDKQMEVLWYETTSSFDPTIITQVKNRIPNFEENFVKEKVRCELLHYLLDKYNVKKINLLLIDAQGCDFEIIKMIPFESIKPEMIYYENSALSNDDKMACRELLVRNGYKIIKSRDTFAYLTPHK